MPNVGPMEIGLVLIIALIVFGPKRLPDLGRSLGKGIREFKGSLTSEDEPEVSRPAAIEPAGSDAVPTRAPDAGPAGETPA